MSSSVSQAERASILESLSSLDEEVRRLAVEQLLVLPISEAADQLFERLGDTGWRVRKAAVERLVVCGGQAAVQEMLIGALADGENSGSEKFGLRSPGRLWFTCDRAPRFRNVHYRSRRSEAGDRCTRGDRGSRCPSSICRGDR